MAIAEALPFVMAHAETAAGAFGEAPVSPSGSVPEGSLAGLFDPERLPDGKLGAGGLFGLSRPAT
jgi:hypothetical protein